MQSGYIYSRLGNPTCEAVEGVIKALEGGAGSMTFSSGMAAVCTAITGVVKPGDHVVRRNHVFLKSSFGLCGVGFSVLIAQMLCPRLNFC